MSAKRDLFDDVAAPRDEKLAIDKDFARYYNQSQQKQRLQKLKDRYKNVNSESDSYSERSSSFESDTMNPAVDAQVLSVIARVRNDDPKLKGEEGLFTDESKLPQVPKELNTKLDEYKQYVKAVEQQEEDELKGRKTDKTGGEEIAPVNVKDVNKMYYKYLMDVEKASGGGLLSEKKGTDDVDVFLKDYIKNRKWAVDNEVDLDDESVEEEASKEDFEDAAFTYEEYHNNRYVDPKAEALAEIALNQVQSHRKKTTKRKEERMRKKQQQIEAEEQRKKEIQELREAKRKEYADRLKLLADEAGLGNKEDTKEVHSDEEMLKEIADNLEDDWDPEEHEKLMAKLFGKEYYEKDENKGFEKEMKETLDDKKKKLSDPSLIDYLQDIYGVEDDKDSIPFRYIEVPKEDGGLTAAEILGMSDKQLNKRVSFTRLAPYIKKNDKEFDKWRKQRMEHRLKLKQECIRSARRRRAQNKK